MRKHRQLGPYALLQRLGHRGESRCATLRWLAHKPGDHSYTHLKIFEGISPWQDRDRHWARAAQEARALRASPHPNLPRVHGVGFSKERAEGHLATEYLHGHTLAQRLPVDKPGGAKPLPWQEAVEIARQLCDALEHIHHLTDPDTSEPLHLSDLQIGPEQILITHTGRVKLLGVGDLRQWKRGFHDTPSTAASRSLVTAPSSTASSTRRKSQTRTSRWRTTTPKEKTELRRMRCQAGK